MATPLRRRRLGLGMLLLAAVVVVLMAMPWWRERQLRTSCEQGHGRWESESQRCTFGTPPSSASDRAANGSTANTNPAPEPR